MKQEHSLSVKYLQIFIAVAIYWVISILTVFVNKAILSSKAGGLDAPLFITWFQCLISFVICNTLSVTKGIPGIFEFPEGTPWKTETVKVVLPLSLMFTGAIASANICLQNVGVAFYYISRSLTTVCNVILGSILLGQKTSLPCVLCCTFMIFGFWLGVDQENLIGSFSLYGTIFGIISSVSLSLYSIYTKRVLPHVNQEVWLLSYYNNAYSIIIFIPLIIINGELARIWEFKNFNDHIFWIQMIGSGLCGFAIGLATSFQIKITSPLTHNISGTAKACAQTIIATNWYNETKTPLWWSSNMIVLAASALYTRFKQLEMVQASVAAEKMVKEEKENLI